jgi:hypothetical protein
LIIWLIRRTLFLTELKVGDRIYVQSTGEYFTVTNITSNELLTVSIASGVLVNAQAWRKRECISIGSGMLSLDNGYPDGVYYLYIIYTTTDSIEHVFEREYFFDCHTQCCVFKMVGDIPSYYNCDNCNSDYINSALLVYSLYISMKWHAARCNFANAVKIKEDIDRICEFNKCNC